ncbi:MAG: hypothetical protein JW891_14105 [Candidatus Lokiarchaeota archaeon]|nr:hypothetical protein [Candidatus Lokiarchaeota archaeon]
MSSDIDDFINRIRKLFKVGAENFDLDVFIFPETNTFENNPKGFKVSYHFEEGKEDPEIKIEENIEERDLKNLIKNSNKRRAKLNKTNPQEQKRSLDASDFVLEDCDNRSDFNVREPYTEINDFDSFTEIIIDIPGIQKDQISTDFDEINNILSFYAEKDDKSYLKDIQIPYKSTNNDISVELNNGLIIIKVSRSE